MNLIKLAERVEAATAGQQRELLADAWDALGPINKWDHHDARYFGMTLDAEAYESAALMMVPKGYFWTVGKCDLTCHATVGPDRAHFDHEYLVKHQPVDVDIANPSTPALALVAACLRAKAGEGSCQAILDD